MASLAIYCQAAIADSPLPPPSLITVCNSPNSHCATSNPASSKTILANRATGEALWSIDGYFRYFDVSNDGRTVLIQSDFGNFLPLNAGVDQALFSFVRDGRSLHVVKLGDLFRSAAELTRTASHLSWGHLEKIDGADNANFLLVDGRRVSYNLATGMRLGK